MCVCLPQVALHIPGAYNLSMHLPVVIGTVPYRRLSPAYLLQSAAGSHVGIPRYPVPSSTTAIQGVCHTASTYRRSVVFS